MKLTIEELRKVYQTAFHRQWNATNRDPTGEALLAVARFVAERQRAVEPTQEMVHKAYEDQPDAIQAGFGQAYRAMSAVAPLVVPE